MQGKYFVAGLCLSVLAASAGAQSKGPTEAQCRSLIDGMLDTMKATPLKTDKEKQGARELIERVEKLVKGNRARGVPECETYAAMAKIIANQ
ncbi:hypothetical protein [Inhella proteolytica]|uniref:Uncharacterized protein n=1 Tax=Inhella proteolytica TaxID=2795029 RepID=A0A931J1F4_9BURK|nr:hypothetical protein [Inhella proteolytica]MBH9576968.1 hypothetical protein [Inhella proteolytica]